MFSLITNVLKISKFLTDWSLITQARQGVACVTVVIRYGTFVVICTVSGQIPILSLAHCIWEFSETLVWIFENNQITELRKLLVSVKVFLCFCINHVFFATIEGCRVVLQCSKDLSCIAYRHVPFV